MCISLYKKRKHKVIAALLIFLFLAYYVVVSLFIHTHIINGVRIVHMHFAKDSFSYNIFNSINYTNDINNIVNDTNTNKEPIHEHSMLDFFQLYYFVMYSILFFVSLYFLLKLFNPSKQKVHRLFFIIYDFLLGHRIFVRAP